MARHMYTILIVLVFCCFCSGSLEVLNDTINRGVSSLSSIFSVDSIIKAFKLLAVTSKNIFPKYPKSCKVKEGDVFDFIIVGGGTAGLVVANRLTEVENWSVAVFEDGDDPPAFLSGTPGLFPTMVHSAVDRNYLAEINETISQHLNSRRVAYTKGRMLGGSSELDHLIYERSTYYDSQEWVSLGNEGWDYETVLKFYKKSEKMLDKRILNGPTAKYHSTKGLLSVNGQTINKQFQEIVNELLAMFSDIGMKILPEINIPKPNGTSKAQVKITKDGSRASTALAYLLPIKNRKNLCIVKNALVTKILVNDKKIAKGVKIALSSGHEIDIYARKEIILCAGAFNSPQLLMLTGIGPKLELEKINITVIQDLAVGFNLQDHVTVPLVHSGKKSIITTLESVLSIIDSGTLPLPLVDGTFSLGQEIPNLQHISVIFGASSPLFLIILHLCFNFGLPFTLSHLLKNPDRELLLSLVVNAKPKSRGQVTLRSNNPRDPPKISTGFFSEKEDLKTIVAAIRKINSVTNTTYFKKAAGSFSRPPLAECDGKIFDSDDYWECYAKVLAGTSFYPVGTCAMGIVTDSTLKVKGIQKLRVIDESIMPTSPCGKTGAIVIMIAELATDFIKKEYGINK